jgi:hypothetical protein
MGDVITKQPNGKYARFSTIVDNFTHINMTADEYINMCIERAVENAREDAKKVLEYHTREFAEVMEDFNFYNPGKKKMREALITAMNDPEGKMQLL